METLFTNEMLLMCVKLKIFNYSINIHPSANADQSKILFWGGKTRDDLWCIVITLFYL